MSDLTEKLMELLSDSENMEKIQSLSNLINASTDGSNDSSSTSQKKKNDDPHEPQQEQSASDIIPLDAIQTMMKLMPLISSLNKEDENTRLLYALRPHLGAKRQAKLDELVKMLQIFKLLPLLRSQGLF